MFNIRHVYLTTLCTPCTRENSRTADLVKLYQANKKAIEMGSSVASGGRTEKVGLPDLVSPDEIDSSENPYAEGGADIG